MRINTYKLSLVRDEKTPVFKRLKFEEVYVSATDVVRQGIHPIGIIGAADSDAYVHKRITEILNEDRFKLANFIPVGYCNEVVALSSHWGSHYENKSLLMRNLENISGSVLFVENLEFLALLELAKKLLRENWSKDTALNLVRSCFLDFKNQRRFLKKKHPGLSMRSHGDLTKLELEKLPVVEDFEGLAEHLVQAAYPEANFRKPGFINAVTKKDNLLCLADGFKHFTLCFKMDTESVSYSCSVKQELIELIPAFGSSSSKRAAASLISRKWKKEGGKFCFSIDFDALEEILQTDAASMRIEGFSYKLKDESPREYREDVEAELCCVAVKGYSVSKFTTAAHTNKAIQELLRWHSLPVTGTKEELVEKLALLYVEKYEQNEADLKEFFRDKKFIRVPSMNGHEKEPFPVLREHRLRNALLTMYLIKHMRANTIVDDGYENTSFSNVELARALVQDRLKLTGRFISVE